jgi:hypothetical protein
VPNYTAMKTWGDLEKLTPADYLVYFTNNIEHLQDWLGELGYEQVVADSAGFTTTEVTLITLPVTIPEGGRNARLEAELDLQTDVADSWVEVRLMEGTTVLKRAKIRPGAVNQAETLRTSSRLVAPSPGSHTYTVRAVRLSGTGTITMKASLDTPAFARVDSA